MASRVAHFEIPSDNPERTAQFYTSAFGWSIQKWDGPQEYWLVDTGEGQPGINGGIMRRGGPFDRVINTVNVDDVDASTRRVQELGGSLVGDKITIPEYRLFAVCTRSRRQCVRNDAAGHGPHGRVACHQAERVASEGLPQSSGGPSTSLLARGVWYANDNRKNP